MDLGDRAKMGDTGDSQHRPEQATPAGPDCGIRRSQSKTYAETSVDTVANSLPHVLLLRSWAAAPGSSSVGQQSERDARTAPLDEAIGQAAKSNGAAP